MTLWLATGPVQGPPGAYAAQTATRPASNPVQEYQQRFSQLAPNDIEGHYKLAEWCRSQQQYDLLLGQAQYVLKLNPGHENARLLVSIATREIEARHTATGPADRPDAGPPGEGENADREFVTKKDIQKIRSAELQDFPDTGPGRVGDRGPRDDRRFLMDQREHVQVQFGKDVLADFLEALSGDRDFSSRRDRERFYELAPTEQLQLIREYKADAYADRIEILSDPLSLRKFKKVLPVLAKGCGATGCHVGLKAAKPFRLRTARPNADENLYTNFLILDRVVVGRHRLVDRASPKDSLVLQYGLPASYARKSHVPQIEVFFVRGLRDPKYGAILDWIETLRFPAPRTGIVLPGYPEPPPPGASLGAKPQPDKEGKPEGPPPEQPAPAKK